MSYLKSYSKRRQWKVKMELQVKITQDITKSLVRMLTDIREEECNLDVNVLKIWWWRWILGYFLIVEIFKWFWRYFHWYLLVFGNIWCTSTCLYGRFYWCKRFIDIHLDVNVLNIFTGFIDNFLWYMMY
jgi:hypothetical protein